MKKIRLSEYLEKERELHSGIAVSSSLIDNLEVYGFINCKSRADVLSGYDLSNTNGYGDVNMEIDPQKCRFFSFFMKQDNNVTPLYPIISICQDDIDVDVKELYIPSFVGAYSTTKVYDDYLYRKIKTRFGKGYEVSEDEWKKAGWPSRYSLVDNAVLSHIQKGEIVLNDKDGCIKSVGDSILVLCRYLQEETGELRFLFSRLEHLYYEIKDEKKRMGNNT